MPIHLSYLYQPRWFEAKSVAPTRGAEGLGTVTETEPPLSRPAAHAQGAWSGG
jgi:hypothetical protein